MLVVPRQHQDQTVTAPTWETSTRTTIVRIAHYVVLGVRRPSGGDGHEFRAAEREDHHEQRRGHPGAEEALADGHTLEGYAYARVGYHRGLDALRGHGWKGHGPVPYSHEPNRGFLRSLAALGKAAAQIGEMDEAARIEKFLNDSDPEAAGKIAQR